MVVIWAGVRIPIQVSEFPWSGNALDYTKVVAQKTDSLPTFLLSRKKTFWSRRDISSAVYQARSEPGLKIRVDVVEQGGKGLYERRFMYAIQNIGNQ